MIGEKLPRPHDREASKMRDASDVRRIGANTLRQLEIRHRDEVDITLNHDATLAPEWGSRLYEVFQERCTLYVESSQWRSL